MLISANHRFVFIHIRKTGGGSVVKLLADLTGEPRNTWRGIEFVNHGLAADVLAACPELRSYYKFAFVRNPWDRLVSMFHWVRTGMHPVRSHQHAARTFMLGFPTFREYVLALYDSFQNRADFDPAVLSHGTRDGLVAYIAQWPYVYDAAGNSLVDYIGRFETLARSVVHVLKQVGLNPPGMVLPHVHRAERGCYQEYYQPDTARMVGEIYARDCELFGYEFEGDSAKFVRDATCSGTVSARSCRRTG